jgi:hypothetical protein
MASARRSGTVEQPATVPARRANGRATGSGTTPTVTPVVRRIDRLIIRVDDDQYDELYALFADVLRLPTPWPPTEHTTTRSGGIFAGNVDFELLYVPAEPIRDQAQLYGIVFEGWAEDASGLAERGFAYLPTLSMQKEAGKSPKLLGTNYFLESFWHRNRWEKVLFALKKLVPDAWWMKSWMQSTSSGSNASAVQWLFNQVYQEGIVFLVRYNPAWRDIDAERRVSKAQLEIRAGGALGLIRVKEIAVGTTQLTESSLLWRKLLRPAMEETGLCWQVGDGPALRVITAERDALHHMVWEVASLDDAQQALFELDLLGTVRPDQITLDPAKCFGLDIRLVEAPGGFTSFG